MSFALRENLLGSELMQYMSMQHLCMTSDIESSQTVRSEIGAFAAPDKIQWAQGLPKTRSGKIMRRILRKISSGVTDQGEFGDISTLAEPGEWNFLLQRFCTLELSSEAPLFGVNLATMSKRTSNVLLVALKARV